MTRDQARKPADTTTDAPAPAPAPRGGGAPLPPEIRAKMERAFAADFSAIRVHEDGTAEATGALAYARGNDVHLASGLLDGGERGLEVLGHELAHVVQQRSGRAPAQGGGAFAIDTGLEAEADDLGRRAARGDIVATSPAPAAGGAATAVAQPKLGFEIELNVLVSRHVGKTDDAPKDELPVGKTGDIHWVSGNPYRWRDELTKQDTDEDVIKPKDYDGKGGWVHWGEWGERGTTGTDEDEYCDPMMSKESFFKGTHVEAKVDHAPSLSVGARRRNAIIELVTAAKEETADDFLAPMAEACAHAEKLQKLVGERRRAPVQDVLGSSLDNQLFLGAQLAEGETQFQSLDGYVQATLGTRIGAMHEVMEDRVQAHRTSRDGEVYESTLAAVSRLDGVLAELGITRAAAPHLYGYLELVCLYLVGGNSNVAGTGKNAVPMLLRDRFSSVRNTVVPAQESQLVASFDVRKRLADALMKACGRSPGDPLIKTTQFKSKSVVATWLEDVLSGAGDGLWDEWDSARVIGAEAVGPDREMGAVVEERNPLPNGTRLMPNQWMPFAEKHQQKTAKLNTPTEMTGSVSVTAKLETPEDKGAETKAPAMTVVRIPRRQVGKDEKLLKGQRIWLDDNDELEGKVLAAVGGIYVQVGQEKFACPVERIWVPQ